MRTDASEPLLGGIALLDALRPPPGYLTFAALATTYSLELEVVLACLIALSGGARDDPEFTLPAALSALQKRRDNVRILVQRGRITRGSDSHGRVLHMADSIVREVAFDENDRSFHPKLWVVRYQDPTRARSDVFRLLISSKNLTTSRSLDLAVMLEGATDAEGQMLDDLDVILRDVVAQSDAGSVMQRIGALAQVRWRLPPGVSKMGVGAQGLRPMSWKQTALGKLLSSSPMWFLAVSPFADAGAFGHAAQMLGDERRCKGSRFVIGRPDLDAMASDLRAREHLGVLEDVRYVAPTLDEVGVLDAEDGQVSDDLAFPDEHGVHAKVYVAWSSTKEWSCLLGSPNFTRRGWLRQNFEVWLRLDGRGTDLEALWSWSERQPRYILSSLEEVTPRTLAEELQDRADDLCKELACHQLVLYEPADAPSELRSDRAWMGGEDVTLAVGRLSTSAALVTWAPTATAVALQPCLIHERTSLLRCRVTVKRDDVEAVRDRLLHVTLQPALDLEQRDGAVMARVLDPASFLGYLRGLLDPAAFDSSEADSRTHVEHGVGQGAFVHVPDALSLEFLLRSFARVDASRHSEVRRLLDEAIATYRRAGSAENLVLLEPLWTLWEALSAGLGTRRLPA